MLGNNTTVILAKLLGQASKHPFTNTMLTFVFSFFSQRHFVVLFPASAVALVLLSGLFCQRTQAQSTPGKAAMNSHSPVRLAVAFPTPTPTPSAIQLQILEPNDQPVTDNNFTFDTTPFPNGKCNVTAIGTSGVASQNANLQWQLEAINAINQGVGSTLTSNPNPPKGPNITFTYKGLPSLNYQFGEKTLTLSHPNGGTPRTQTVKIFFNGTDDATNHPGEGTGVTPNWFFYWKQTGAGYGDVQYTQNGTLNGNAQTKFVNNQWVAYVSYNNNNWYTPFLVGDNAGNPLNGIDHFAWVCRHESRHKQLDDQYFPNGPFQYQVTYDEFGLPVSNVNPVDQDGDGLADVLEGSGSPYGYETDHIDTNGDGVSDLEDYVQRTQAPWTEGSNDSLDWANPGHQSAN